MRFPAIFIVLLTLLGACRSQKQITNNYLMNARDTIIRDSAIFRQPIIQKGDLLSIRVYSIANGIDTKPDAPYNLVESAAAGATSAGYLVDESGNIDYPQLGTMHVEGMTREQVAADIKSKLSGVLTQPSVIVRYINFRFTVLGEVGRPGTFTAATERISILEALGLAGDVTEFGQKSTVKIIRENNGVREIGTLDLTSKEMFTSPFFRLQQNDVVLVEQTRRKVKQQERQEILQQIAIGSSIITAIALILNFIK